jgi:HAE1 family hydrophobic/amphiphilic exporter-1
MRVFLQNPPAIRIGGQVTKSMYQYTLSSPQTDQLYQYAQKFEARMRNLPGVTDVTSDLQIENPQANVVVDREKASALGVTPQQVEDALYSAYGQRLVSPIYTSNDEYWVVLEVQKRFQSDPDMLSELYIHSSSGQLVPLSAVSKFTTDVGPLTVNHSGQLPSVTISFDLGRGVALGQAEPSQLDAADLDHHQLPRHRPGVPTFAHRSGHSVNRDRRGDLHRAGHPL